jgi:hypothetical protein
LGWALVSFVLVLVLALSLSLTLFVSYWKHVRAHGGCV